MLRMRLPGRAPIASAEDLERVAGVARGLEPHEVLAVRSHAGLRLSEMRHRLGALDLRELACAFAPDDHELFIWRPPPEPPSPSRPSLAGELALDARRMSPRLSLIAAVAAVAGLRPGEVLVHISDRPPVLLIDLLAGRAAPAEVRPAGRRVLTRLVRCPAGSQ